MQAPTKIIPTAHLLPLLDKHLITLLSSFGQAEWELPTVAPLWRVKDIAVHLLDGNLRTLSILRDGYFGETPPTIHYYQDLVQFLNQLNAEWVKAFRRVSPKVLVELLQLTGTAVCQYFATLAPYEKAVFSVAWAGEAESYNWFHVAREYTEKWHHQQQIRLAVHQTSPLYQKDLYYPYLATSMCALPHHYRHTTAPEGSSLVVTVLGEGGGTWTLHYDQSQWHLTDTVAENPICTIQLAEEVAWRIFTKGITKKEAQAHVVINGDVSVGEKIFEMLAVMA
jgi:hypothetical protein